MRHEVRHIPEGWRGTDQTVATISRLVDASLRDPLVVTTAQNIVRHVPERDKDAEIRAVSAFVRSKVRYTNEAIETIKTPRLLLSEIRRYGRAVGDCDDHVVLWLALHRALGHPVRVKVVSQKRDRTASHIYGQVHSPARGWVTDELIVKHRPLGWEVPAGETTAAKLYAMSGVGELDMAEARRFFVPGGTTHVPTDRMLPKLKYLTIPPVMSSHVRMKRGGMLDVGPRGDLGAVLNVVGTDIPGLSVPDIQAMQAKLEAAEAQPSFLTSLTQNLGPVATELASKWMEHKQMLARIKAERMRFSAPAGTMTPSQPPLTEPHVVVRRRAEPPPAKPAIPTGLILAAGAGLVLILALRR